MASQPDEVHGFLHPKPDGLVVTCGEQSVLLLGWTQRSEVSQVFVLNREQLHNQQLTPEPFLRLSFMALRSVILGNSRFPLLGPDVAPSKSVKKLSLPISTFPSLLLLF